MSYYFDIEKGYDQLIDVLKRLFELYKIPFNKKFEEFVDIRAMNFNEIQDEFVADNLVKLKSYT